MLFTIPYTFCVETTTSLNVLSILFVFPRVSVISTYILYGTFSSGLNPYSKAPLSLNFISSQLCLPSVVTRALPILFIPADAFPCIITMPFGSISLKSVTFVPVSLKLTLLR